MTKRAKLTLCAGLLALVAGVALALVWPRSPQVELTFVRYTNDGAAVLYLTNRGRYPINVSDPSHLRRPPFPGESRVILAPLPTLLMAHDGVRLDAYTWPRSAALPASITVRWKPVRSGYGTNGPMRERVEVLLQKVGVS